jgi:ADP-ribose pyrophosphatase
MMFNGYYHYLDPVRYARGVALVPVFENGDLLMVRLRRAPVIGFSLEFPRGGVDDGESLADAATRELSEETGYAIAADQAQSLGRIGADTATLNATTDVFRVTIPESALQGAYDTEEIDVPMRISRTQFEAKVRAGEIIDGITLASWALATMHPA